MARQLSIEDLEKHFETTRRTLSRERAEILSMAPLSKDFSLDAYSFSYMRAERVGLSVITNYLEDLSWLPMRLDPKTDAILGDKKAMKKWLTGEVEGQPSSKNFGNDFFHALTRIAILHGWQSAEFRTTTLRIGRLSHDLSCLIGLVYCGAWMAENGIAGVMVTDTEDLELMAKEISTMMLSPEVALFLARRGLLFHATKESKKATFPVFHVIENPNWGEGPHMPPGH